MPPCLHRLHRCIDLSVLGQPSHVSSFGTLFDLPKKFNCFRLVAWLAWVIDGDDHLNLDRNDEIPSLNQTGSFDSFSGYGPELDTTPVLDPY